MVSIEKILSQESDFFEFLCREPAVWLSTKKFFAGCFFFAESFFFFDESFLTGSRQILLCREYRTLSKGSVSGSAPGASATSPRSPPRPPLPPAACAAGGGSTAGTFPQRRFHRRRRRDSM
jgi:hypothetical protein